MKLPWIDAIGTEYGSLSLAIMVLAITPVNLSCTATIALSRILANRRLACLLDKWCLQKTVDRKSPAHVESGWSALG